MSSLVSAPAIYNAVLDRQPELLEYFIGHLYAFRRQDVTDIQLS